MRLRARENPFRTQRILQIQYRLSGISWADLLDRCRLLNYQASVIGPHGSGKTTLLEELSRQIAEAGYTVHQIRLDTHLRETPREERRRIYQQFGKKDIIVLDGAEQMTEYAWLLFRWKSRNCGGLLISCHVAGRLPVIWQCRTSVELLADIAAQLLEVDRQTVLKDAERLFAKHRGNLREALREWYDWAASPNSGATTQRVEPDGDARLWSPTKALPALK
jgi:hypothetical protein